jgi:hypothetical protein
MVTLDKTIPTLTVSTPEMKTADFTPDALPTAPHSSNTPLFCRRITVTPRVKVQR